MGDQHTAERFDLIRQIETLKEITDADVSGVMATLEARLREITDSIEPGTEAWEPTDQTVKEYWATLDRAGQSNFLRDAKVRVEAKPGKFKFSITEAGIIQVTHPGIIQDDAPPRTQHEDEKLRVTAPVPG